jgi:hypothetical protein
MSRRLRGDLRHAGGALRNCRGGSVIEKGERIREMPRNKSHGRHGGNSNQRDELLNLDPNTQATRNTDVESRSRNRNDDRAGGRKR